VGAPPGRSIFAGRTSGDEVTVAVAVDNGTAVAYVCDGHRIESWLRGRVDGDQVRLTGAGGVELTGNVTPHAMLGTIRGAGLQELAFSADVAQPPAGIYRSRTTVNGLDARFGWAVLPDGSETGVADVDGVAGPAPWMDPATGAFDARGTPATATPVAGSDAVGGP
jgi:serine/threonine-protein kinase